MFLFFSLSRLNYKILCLWNWASSQAPVTIVVRLGISVHSSGSCKVGPTTLLERVVHSRGNSSPNIKEKQNCTKFSFWVQVLRLIWLVVVVALLDTVVALVHKGLAQFRLQALLTFGNSLSSLWKWPIRIIIIRKKPKSSANCLR